MSAITSSKFNRWPVPRLRPAICIAPAGSCLPLYDSRIPEYLWAFLRWKDLDPLGQMDTGALVHLGPRSGGGIYTGVEDQNPVRIGATITDHYPSPSVDVQINYWDPFWLALSFTFPNVPMPLDLPFNTHRLHHVTIPDIDYRIADVTE